MKYYLVTTYTDQLDFIYNILETEKELYKVKEKFFTDLYDCALTSWGLEVKGAQNIHGDDFFKSDDWEDLKSIVNNPARLLRFTNASLDITEISEVEMKKLIDEGYKYSCL